MSSILADSANSMSKTVENIQQSLVKKAEDVANVSLSMNRMMEELLIGAIQVDYTHKKLELKPSSETFISAGFNVLINVTNNSPIPVNDVQITIHSGFGSGDKDGQFYHQRKGGRTVLTLKDKALLSGQTAAATIFKCLDLPIEPEIVKTMLRIRSPGTGNELFSTQEFHVKPLDTMYLYFIDKVSGNARRLKPLSGPVTVDLNQMRQLFSVPPTVGIKPGNVFATGNYIETTERLELGLVVKDIAKDLLTATCEWCAAGTALQLPQSKIQALVEQVSIKI